MLLHVVDCGDHQIDETIAQTRKVLGEIGASNVPYMLIYNKIDGSPDFMPADNTDVKSFLISARKNIGISALQAEIIAQSNHKRK